VDDRENLSQPERLRLPSRWNRLEIFTEKMLRCPTNPLFWGMSSFITFYSLLISCPQNLAPGQGVFAFWRLIRTKLGSKVDRHLDQLTQQMEKRRYTYDQLHRRRSMDLTSFRFPYHDDYRFAPNVWLRSALFAARPPAQSRDNPSSVITLKSFELLQHAGTALDQADLDVLLTISNEFGLREMDSGLPMSRLEMPFRGLLQASGRKDGGKNRKWLSESLSRLGGCEVSFWSNTDLDLDSEWHTMIELNDTSACSATINLGQTVRALFAGGFTGINWNERQQLSHLGKWLHAFYSSHQRRPLPIKIQTIRRLCGRGNDPNGMASTFSSTLAAELLKLADITGWKCRIENHKVVITKGDDGIGGNAATCESYIKRLDAGDWSEVI
jgi:hypothetical protein